MFNEVNKYVDLRFLSKFTLILLLLYYLNRYYLRVIDPLGFYSPFIDQHFNYVGVFRFIILNTSNAFAHVFGLNAHVVDNIRLKIFDGAGVRLGVKCIGFTIMIFWIAFVFAHTNTFSKKMQWALIGVITIFFINCLRISVLLLALQNKWQVNKYINHHDLFNLIAYAIIILMIYFFNVKNHKSLVYNSSL